MGMSGSQRSGEVKRCLEKEEGKKCGEEEEYSSQVANLIELSLACAMFKCLQIITVPIFPPKLNNGLMSSKEGLKL